MNYMNGLTGNLDGDTADGKWGFFAEAAGRYGVWELLVGRPMTDEAKQKVSSQIWVV